MGTDRAQTPASQAETQVCMGTRQTIRTLNRLIRTCRDGEAVCTAWSAAAESRDLWERLTQRSQEWSRQADELQALVLLLGGRPAMSATVSGHLLEAWITLKTLAFGRNDLPVILDWEHSQRGALRRYQHALEDRLSERIRRTVTQQATRLSEHQHRLEDLRGRFAALSF
jgi:uncharacterized protein (TIGR02284 family)